MDVTEHDETALETTIGTLVVGSFVTLIFLGPWFLLMGLCLWTDQPTTWWRWIFLILLPVPGVLTLLVNVNIARKLLGYGNQSPTTDDDLERLFQGGKFFIRRGDEPDAPMIPVGSYADMERLMDLAESPEHLRAHVDSLFEPPVPKRPLLYMFQHVALREATFENHPELLRELNGEHSFTPLLHFQSKAQIRCEDAGLLADDHDLDDSAFEANLDLFKEVVIHPGKRDGYTIYVVTMPKPEHSPEAYMVAIVHKDDESKNYMEPSRYTRYFTLEKSSESIRPLLCEWRRDGSRQNYGDGPNPEIRSFSDAVFKRVIAGPSG